MLNLIMFAIKKPGICLLFFIPDSNNILKYINRFETQSFKNVLIRYK